MEKKNVYVFCFSVFPPTKVDHSNLTLSSLEVHKKSQCLKLCSDNIICIQKSKISMKTPHLIYCVTICFPLYFLKGIIGELCLISQVNFHNLWKSNIWTFSLGACSERIWKPGHQLKRVKESKQGFKLKSWWQGWWKSGLNNWVHVKNSDRSEKPQADSNADGSVS